MDDQIMLCLLHGDIDHHSARVIRAQLDEEILRKHPLRFTMDLSHVTFMDSSGLGLILGRFNRTAELGIAFTLRNPNAEVTKILDLAGIERLIHIERTQHTS